MSSANRTFDPESFVREAYAIAERMDLEGWKSLFANDGVFIDNSVKITYRGSKEWDYPVRQYGTAFADMHRELYDFWTVGNTVFVRLALQGTHTDPLETPFGTIPPTGNRMDAPCADIWELENGKIKKFDCYPEGSVILTQLGVISNLEAALSHSADSNKRATVHCSSSSRTRERAPLPGSTAMERSSLGSRPGPRTSSACCWT